MIHNIPNCLSNWVCKKSIFGILRNHYAKENMPHWKCVGVLKSFPKTTYYPLFIAKETLMHNMYIYRRECHPTSKNWCQYIKATICMCDSKTTFCMVIKPSLAMRLNSNLRFLSTPNAKCNSHKDAWTSLGRELTYLLHSSSRHLTKFELLCQMCINCRTIVDFEHLNDGSLLTTSH